MDKNILLLGLVLGALFLLRTRNGSWGPIQGQMETGNPGPGIPGTTGMWGEG